MQYDLKKTCPECPYAPKTKGWIGEHDSALDFHDAVKQDIDFPCHMSKEQCCVGNALYMNSMCKISRDPQKAAYQNRLKQINKEVILFSFDGSELVNFHGR
ncbi:hypothetical protein [Acinetobacter higginsii]|uniref:hypothetical protein n=1 Tax=Acinetobacter higginsii TaxID=70347 RepID=UPI001F4B56EA|nr:hypothetical protein [Acinetobacter higginsii]MCH7295447.1 hypothetical protein [Acinetobacter higginsii]